MRYSPETSFCVKYWHEWLGENVWYAIGSPQDISQIKEMHWVEILGVVLCEWTEEMQEYAATLKDEYLWLYIAEVFNENLHHTNS